MNSFFNNLKYLYSFLHYLYKNFPIFRYLIFGAFFLIFVEYVALSISLLLIENNYNEPMCEEYLKQYGYKKINRIAVNDFYMK